MTSKAFANTIKLSDIVSVTDFGAVGDGVTDDRAAIAAAVTAASGLTVVFPPGVYRVASPYAAPDGTRFYLHSGASFSVNTPTGAVIEYERYNTAAVAGSVMKIDRLVERSSYPLKDEGGIWSAGTYTYFGVSSEITAATVNNQGNGTLTGGPVTNLFSFVSNNGAGGDVVAFLGDGVARTNNGTVFAANLIARNGAGVTGAKLVGLEVDLQPAVGTTISSQSAGYLANVFSIATSAPVFLAGGVGGGTWGNGFLTAEITGAHYAVSTANVTTSVSFIDTTQGLFSSSAIKLGRGASQAVNFGGFAFGTSPYLYSDTSNNLLLNMGNGGFVVFQAPGGAQRFTFDQFGVLNMPNNGAIRINTTQVVGSRRTGWTAATGSATRTTFDTTTVTTAQLAERVKALIDDLITHGLIGT